jgi:hypothetical protein
MTFGRLEVTGFTRAPDGRRVVELRCDCGQAAEAKPSHLLRGEKRSCGCLRRERLAAMKADVELLRLAGKLRRDGLEPDEILDTLKSVNAKRCVPPLTDDEVARLAGESHKWPPSARPKRDPSELSDLKVPAWRTLGVHVDLVRSGAVRSSPPSRKPCATNWPP